MGIIQLSQRIAPAVQKAAYEFKEGAGSMQRKDQCWTRSLAVGSLITGAVLLARGKRKAGLATSIAGAAIALLENPEDAAEAWKRIPTFLDRGRQWLEHSAALIDDLSRQGDKVRSFLENTRP